MGYTCGRATFGSGAAGANDGVSPPAARAAEQVWWTPPGGRCLVVRKGQAWAASWASVPQDEEQEGGRPAQQSGVPAGRGPQDFMLRLRSGARD
eukprot:4383734-Lingulodinium_polyedra.AAC.1